MPGIRDKEALWDLLVKINILSRSPSPDIAPGSGFRTRQIAGFLGIDRVDGRTDKDKYIHDWLAVDNRDNSAAKEEKLAKAERQPASFETESRKVKMASSIISKMKLYKKVGQCMFC